MTERGRTTRAALLSAATRLVRDVGYAQTTTRAVAQEAGVAEGTLYRHFPDKLSLLLAAAVEQHAPIVEQMHALPRLAGTGTVLDNLAGCLEQLSQMRETLLPLELAMLTDPELRAARDRLRPDPGLLEPPALLAEYLRAEQELGRVRADVDPAEAAVLLLLMLFGLMAAPPPPGPPASLPVPPDIRRSVELLLTGLAPSP